jgi:hypothetical protein
MKERELFPRSKTAGSSSDQSSAREPRFWIEEVRLLRDFASGHENEIRRVVLRRGLNIIWAEAAPPAAIDESSESDRANGGHAAGKTSFCRIIRFLLGEPHFGSQFMRSRILNSFPDGWTVGKIWVANHCWIVARPFYPGARPWTVKSENVEDIFASEKNRLPYAEFVDALNSTALSDLSVSSYGTTGKDIQFLHLLAWLGRDQECRFSGLLDWRHPQSNHDTPETTAEEKRLLIRATLGLTDEEERQIIEKRKRLEDRVNKLPTEIEYFRRVLHESIEGLGNYLPLENLPKVEEPLFVDSVARAVKQKEDAAVAPLEQAMQKLKIEEYQKELEEKIAIRGAAEQRQKEIQEEIEQVETVLQESKSGKAEAGTQAWLNTLPPDRDHCRIPMAIARFRCPLQPLAEKPSTEEHVLELSLDEKVQICEAKLTQLNANVQQAGAAASQMLTSEGKARTRYQQEVERKEELLEKIRDVREIHRIPRDLSERASDAQQSIELQQKEVEKLNAEIENSKKRQEELQVQRIQVQAQFSDRYQDAVQSVLGSDTEAVCRFTREEIRLEISRNGELESGAIDTIKILTFDLATLGASVAGIGSHPRFLLHDSPREADMAAGLYHWIFRLAKNLEALPPSEFNGFQYILTTTEPPPEDLRKEPWLRLTLDASREDQRLFKKDL